MYSEICISVSMKYNMFNMLSWSLMHKGIFVNTKYVYIQVYRFHYMFATHHRQQYRDHNQQLICQHHLNKIATF